RLVVVVGWRAWAWIVFVGCRGVVHAARATFPLARRPVLFSLARALGEACPVDAPREHLFARACRVKLADESDRARVRVV
ncbi:helix-turn-helix domain-containing protein, partial [Burkholderia pseudomallei]